MWIGFEPVGIRGGRDIDGHARVVVDVPSATEVVLALENDEVLVPEALELYRAANAAETRADDDGVERIRVHSVLRVPVPYRQNKLSLRYATLIGHAARRITVLPACDLA